MHASPQTEVGGRHARSVTKHRGLAHQRPATLGIVVAQVQGGQSDEARRPLVNKVSIRVSAPLSAEAKQQLLECVDRANAGDIVALCTLAATFKESSPDEAKALFIVAARRGEPKAMVDLAIMLKDSGEIEEATMWLSRAAELGNAQGMLALGHLAAQDDPATAMTWYEKAAERGNAHAMTELATKLWKKDRSAATRWFELAVSKERPQAMHNYACALYPDQRERCLGLWRKAAEAGFVPSMRKLGQRLAKRDLAEARFWLEKGASLGDDQCRSELYDLGSTTSSRWRRLLGSK